MIHYLRSNGRTVVDAESIKDDFHVVVCIDVYSDILLSVDLTAREETIKDFHDMQELRGEYFETPACNDETPDEFLTRKFSEFANKYNLSYTTD